MKIKENLINKMLEIINPVNLELYGKTVSSKNFMFFKNEELLSNRRHFSLEIDLELNEVYLRTTFSNQEVNEQYLQELNTLMALTTKVNDLIKKELK